MQSAGTSATDAKPLIVAVVPTTINFWTSYSKLDKRFYGPYCILERFGPVAYKIELPPSARVHPVFHCSLLKSHICPLPPISDSPPPPLPAATPVIAPSTILNWRVDSSTTPPTTLALVQWEGLSPEDATWENWQELQNSYHLEDKVTLQGDGSDSTTNSRDLSNNTTVGRPKRITQKPIYLKDYVTTKK